MNLGVITDCIHYQNHAGEVGSDIHVLVKQLSTLAESYEKVVIASPFAKQYSKIELTYYRHDKIEFIKLPNVGGNTIKDKLVILKTIPIWFRAFWQISLKSDIVYQRFPNNLNIPGFFFFLITRKKVFATYTGTWTGYRSEPWTYQLQRFLLRNIFLGPVFVYQAPSENRKNIYSTVSPSYSLTDWEQEESEIRSRIDNLKNTTYLKNTEIKLLTVGSLSKNKNQIFILKACQILKKWNFQFRLYIAGDGPEKQAYQDFLIKNGLEFNIELLGHLSTCTLRKYYRECDFVIQSPLKEGYGKVPFEGLLHGTIPLLSDVNVSNEIVGFGQHGYCFSLNNYEELAQLIKDISPDYSKRIQMISRGRLFVKTHTLEEWSHSIATIVNLHYRF